MLVVSILASLVSFLDGSIINVALPAISKDLHGGLITQQWVVDAYLITLGSLMLVAGSFSDLFGHKRILQIGLLSFGVTSLLCAVAPSAVFLIIARGLQGVAGALLVPSSLALLIANFHGTEQGKAIGRWTAWTTVSFIIGPLLGGLLIDVWSWRLIFLINVIPIAVTLRLLIDVKEPARKQHIKLDYMGAILCSLGLGLPIFGLIEQGRYGWTHPLIYGTIALGALLFMYFLYREGRIKDPMLPLALFSNRNFSVGNLACVALYGGLSIATFLITIFVQQLGGFSATEAGLATIPVTILMFFLSPRFGALATKFGPRLFMAIGPLVAGAGFLTMLRAGQPLHYWTQLFPGILMFGLGLSCTVAPLTAAIMGSISEAQAGIGSAVNNAVSRVASLLAIGLVGVIVGSQLTLAGFHRGAFVMGGLLILAGIVSYLGIRNSDVKDVKQAA